MNKVERTSVVELYKALKGIDKDDDINDDLARAQHTLQVLKNSISELSKQNYTYEQDVSYLDDRIALIIHNKINSDEAREMASRLDQDRPDEGHLLGPETERLYGSLFSLLQSEPQHLAELCNEIANNDIKVILPTVMFSIYGNQFDTREEHLLLVMFQQVLATQFDLTPDYNSLLRANCAVTRMMTTYTRRGPGQAYLQDVMAAPVLEIVACEESLDFRPIKAFRDYKTANPNDPCVNVALNVDQASSHPRWPEIKAIIDVRYKTLLRYLRRVMGVILDNIDKIPYGIRWISKQVKIIAMNRFPDTDVRSLKTLIGAFFFLRFLNPVIAMPQTYMLVDQQPSAFASANLAMVAKVCQSLSNNVYSKHEYYSDAMRMQLEEEAVRIGDFLFDLCEVPDFYDSLELDQYLALTVQERKLKISYNEIIDMHKLLIKYPPSSERVRGILSELGAPPQLEGAQTRGEVELPLASRWEAMLGEKRDEQMQLNVLFLEAKTLLVNIRRTFPDLPKNVSIEKLADVAANSPNASIADRGIRAKIMLSTTLDYSSTNRQLLQEEVEAEVSRLGSLTTSIKDETNSLRNVYVTVREHNEYLESQLNTFRSYLNNIRAHIVPDKKAPSTSSGPHAYSPDQLFDLGILKRWPFGRALTEQLALKFSPGNKGSYSMALVHVDRQNLPVMIVYFTVDDLLEYREKGRDIDLQCMRMAPGPLMGLLTDFC